MNKGIDQKNNIKTSEVNKLLTDPLALQITEALSWEDLSFREIKELTHESRKNVSHDLAMLAKSHVIVRHLRHHHIMYELAQPQLKDTIHILYRLWTNTILIDPERA